MLGIRPRKGSRPQTVFNFYKEYLILQIPVWKSLPHAQCSGWSESFTTQGEKSCNSPQKCERTYAAPDYSTKGGQQKALGPGEADFSPVGGLEHTPWHLPLWTHCFSTFFFFCLYFFLSHFLLPHFVLSNLFFFLTFLCLYIFNCYSSSNFLNFFQLGFIPFLSRKQFLSDIYSMLSACAHVHVACM